ncbi:MAG: family 20 glycosylhydrolase [Rhodothermales bacterium]
MGLLSMPITVFSQNAPELAVSWGVVDNYVGDADYFESRLTLKNDGTETLGDDWAIYFNFIRYIRSDSVRGPFAIRLVNGSFYEMKPKSGFSLDGGDSVSVRLIASNWVIRESAAPAGFYYVGRDGRPRTISHVSIDPFVTPRQVDRFRGDLTPLATPQTGYEKNRPLSLLPDTGFSPVIPTPRQMALRAQRYVLASPVHIHGGANVEEEAAHAGEMLRELFGLEVSTTAADGDDADISLQLTSGDYADGVCDVPESYSLKIGEHGVEIEAHDRAGIFYGVQTLIALVHPAALGSSGQPLDLPQGEIIDCPRFPYRGLMIDVGRHFQPPERIKQTIRFMSFYKLNRLHFHLSDDEGWRVPISDLPELTTVGARRGHTLDSKELLPPSFGSGPDPETSPGSGSYSRAEFVDLLRFATAHHVEVIPEIDTPGHMRAAVKSMESRYRRLMAEGRPDEARQYLLTDFDDTSKYRSVQGWDDNVANVCLESTFRFVEHVVDELSGLFKEAGAPLHVVHLGGDEVPGGVWKGSPACARKLAARDDLSDVHDLSIDFYRRLVAYLDSKGLKGAGWEEIGLGVKTDSVYHREDPKPDLTDKVIPYAWNSVWGWGGEERAYRLANAGYHVVMANAPNLYFDLAYEKHPKDPGFAWAGFVDERKIFEMTPLDLYNSAYEDRFGRTINMGNYRDAVRLDSAALSNIIGIQGQLWGENTPSQARFEYLLYPKLVALAERAWAKRPAWASIKDRDQRLGPLNADWNRFANSLGRRELERLARMYGGVAYRIPPPGGEIVDGILRANVAYPGLQIRYTLDDTEPDIDSALWVEPVKVSGRATLRAFDATGRGGRAVVVGR